MAVLALVTAALLGLLLVNRFQLRRQLASYNDLSQQYSALSEAHDVLKERCTALEQTVRDAQDRAESAERVLEALRRSPEPTPAPTPTPTPTLVPAEQPGMSDAAQSAKGNE